MSQAKTGDTVRVHYTGTLDDGSVFDSSQGRDPLEFTLGEQRVIPGFESAVDGLAVGNSVTTRIPPDEAYGDRRDDLVLEVERDQFPPDVEPEIGMQLALQQPNGQPVPVTITGLSDEAITLDANHRLAGQALTFNIELVEIV
ncbi:MAG: peptidylprolyl isomerase [Aggregatilineales bacterium]